MTKKRIAILGSTGSIGTQALEVIDNNPDKFEVTVITANENVELLIKQAVRYVPDYVVIGKEKKFENLKTGLNNYPIEIHAGYQAICDIVTTADIDIVLVSLVGYAGLLPTINAIEAGKDIALANKETLVVAGKLITDLKHKKNVNLYPVDSEHSAIFQCLSGEQDNTIEKIYLTASGGPFRELSPEKMRNVSIEDALNHPNWCMGAKITIDSASLMNKGLEVIEAKWLFNLNPDQIDVIVHPQSIIHSLVQFEDGSIKAQMGLPDMKLPIQYAFSYPKRHKTDFPRFNFMDYPNLSFEAPDLKKFRNLALSYEALKKGGNVPCVLNAANEIVVDAFLKKKIKFTDMPEIIEKTMNKINYIAHPDYSDYTSSDKLARIYTLEQC